MIYNSKKNIYMNVEFKKENYGVIRFSIGLLLLHKHPLNSKGHGFWDNSILKIMLLVINKKRVVLH